MRYDELKSQAYDETRIGGDSGKALALAVLTLAQAVSDAGADQSDRLSELDRTLMKVADATQAAADTNSDIALAIDEVSRQVKG